MPTELPRTSAGVASAPPPRIVTSPALKRSAPPASTLLSAPGGRIAAADQDRVRRRKRDEARRMEQRRLGDVDRLHGILAVKLNVAHRARRQRFGDDARSLVLEHRAGRARQHHLARLHRGIRARGRSENLSRAAARVNPPIPGGGRQRAQLDCAHHRCCGAVNAQLPVRVLDVARDRMRGNSQSLADLRVSAAIGQQPDDVSFTQGEHPPSSRCAPCTARRSRSCRCPRPASAYSSGTRRS